MSSGQKNNIFLTGFMGAGKTTVGKRLAAMMNYEFCDLDAVIVKKEGRTIKQIFADDGEPYFRDCESQVLAGLEAGSSNVYATGGGVVIRVGNRKLMRAKGCVVYLKAGWDVIKNRLAASTERPLVNSEDGWSSVKELWEQRQAFYNEADLIVDTDSLGPEQVAQVIFERFSRMDT